MAVVQLVNYESPGMDKKNIMFVMHETSESPNFSIAW